MINITMSILFLWVPSSFLLKYVSLLTFKQRVPCESWRHTLCSYASHVYFLFLLLVDHLILTRIYIESLILTTTKHRLTPTHIHTYILKCTSIISSFYSSFNLFLLSKGAYQLPTTRSTTSQLTVGRLGTRPHSTDEIGLMIPVSRGTKLVTRWVREPSTPLFLVTRSRI